MTVLVVVLLIAALIGSMILIVAMEPGPSPSDLAIAYELAWDRLDFATIWSLSDPSMRDGRNRREFVADRKLRTRMACTRPILLLRRRSMKLLSPEKLQSQLLH